jgi:hypothetical protein
LTEIIQYERGQDEREPREPNGLPPEMPHVRIQRLTTGDHQEHSAEHGESGKAIVAKKCQRVARIERAQDSRCPNNPHDAERRDRDEPYDHDRTEEPSHSMRAELLDTE